MKKRQSGFTLIEMMVVIGIIGILAGALFGGFSYVLKSAQRAKATEAVSNAKTALEVLFQKAEGWPQAIIRNVTTHEQGYRVMDMNVAKVLFKYGLLGVDCKKTGSGSDLTAYTLRGVDRCGIVDPWAQEAIKKADQNLDGNSLLMRKVSTGGTVADHRLYFAVDEDDDGFVTKAEHAPVNKVRAKAIVWSAGADGGLGDCSSDKPKKSSANGRSVSNSDNVYSWHRAQEVR